MPYGATHAPSWWDSTHAWVPATADPPPVLHDCHKQPRELPQIVVDGVTGWNDLGEMVDNRAPRTYGAGEVVYPSRFIGLTRIYEAHVEADDRLDFAEMIAGLTTGYGDRSDEGMMTVTPWLPYGGEDPITWTFTALVLALAFDKAPVLGEDGIDYQQAFVLTLRLSDPAFYMGGGGS